MTEKKIVISGTEIITGSELLKKAGLPGIIAPPVTPEKIIGDLQKFYQDGGYTLSNIYIVENRPDLLSLYIDEGRLDKIIFHRLNSIITIRMKCTYSFPKNIYNEKRLREIVSLREKEGYDIVRHSLIPGRTLTIPCSSWTAN